MLNYLENIQLIFYIVEKLEMSYNYWSEVRALVLKSYFDNFKNSLTFYEKNYENTNYENNIAVELLNGTYLV